jgi:hypothetical protein
MFLGKVTTDVSVRRNDIRNEEKWKVWLLLHAWCVLQAPHRATLEKLQVSNYYLMRNAHKLFQMYWKCASINKEAQPHWKNALWQIEKAKMCFGKQVRLNKFRGLKQILLWGILQAFYNKKNYISFTKINKIIPDLLEIYENKKKIKICWSQEFNRVQREYETFTFTNSIWESFSHIYL